MDARPGHKAIAALIQRAVSSLLKPLRASSRLEQPVLQILLALKRSVYLGLEPLRAAPGTLAGTRTSAAKVIDSPIISNSVLLLATDARYQLECSQRDW